MIVIGSGPNGLVAANTLARRGFKVLVVEANARRAGGALGTEALTLPGFRHDVGGGFFPFGRSSPAFAALDLPAAGVEWLYARYESCHPAVDGTFAVIGRGDALETAPFGSARDADTFRALARFHAGVERDLLPALLGPFPSVGPLLRVGLGPLLKIAGMFLRSTRGLSSRLFETEAARRVLPGLGLHVDVGPDDLFGAGLAYMLAVTATTGGYGFPKGGAQSVTDAMVARLAERGGEVRLGARVTRVIVRGGRAAGLVDFDLAGPGTRLLDVYNTAMHWVPLRDPVDLWETWRGVDQAARLRVLAEGYRLDVAGREALVDLGIRRADVTWRRMKAAAEHLGGGWARMWSEGVGDQIRRREAWLTEHRDELTAALL